MAAPAGADPETMTAIDDLLATCDQLLGRVDDTLRPVVAGPWRTPLGGARRGQDGAPWLDSYDVVSQPLRPPAGPVLHVAYVKTLVDLDRLWCEVLSPLASGRTSLAGLPRVATVVDDTALTRNMLSGYVAIWSEGGGPARVVDVQAAVGRTVEEAKTESAITGPKVAFVERLDANVGLVRDHLRDPALRVDRLVVGRRSRTDVALLYVADVADPALVAGARRGLEGMAVDSVRSVADLSAQLYAGAWTPFPLVEHTERPDKVIASLLNGRIAVIPDGSPFALVVPTTVWRFVEDSETTVLGSAPVVFARALRLIGLGAATGAAGLYVALTSATTTILPVRLAVDVSASRFGLPYPPLTEALIALVIADVLVEATVQASKNIGNALTIVGTLIIGQMLVQARLASNLMMVVVAASVLGSFLTVSVPMSYAIRIWKYVLVLCAGLGGIAGWTGGWLLLLAHLASLKSAGMPYLSPFGPVHLDEIWQYGVRPQPPAGRRLRPSSWRPRQALRARPEGRP